MLHAFSKGWRQYDPGLTDWVVGLGGCSVQYGDCVTIGDDCDDLCVMIVCDDWSFISLIDVLRLIQEYVTYTTVASIIVGENQAEPEDKPASIRRLLNWIPINRIEIIFFYIYFLFISYFIKALNRGSGMKSRLGKLVAF